MKQNRHLITLLLLFFIALLAGCQKEEEEFIDETDDETITANSVLGDLLVRSALQAGELDNIIDGSDCVTVVLPITVFANGQEVLIQDEDDIEQVEAIFDQFPNDTDTLEIQFPITVILADFSQVEINSQTELDTVIANCETDFDEAIACVDFVYPITFFTYNQAQEQTGTVTINSQPQLYDFLNNLDDDDFIAVDFPITVLVNEQSVQVTTNAELLTVLSEANCEDDDDPIDTTQLEDDLTTGVWYITYYFDDTDQTDAFQGYEFSFAANNTAQASSDSNTVNGSWMFTSETPIELILFFGNNAPFDELDEDWEILEATDEIFRLRDLSGDGSTDFLTFERTPNNDGSNEEVNEFIQDLTTGTWFVTLFDDSGDDETSNYEGFEFTYFANGTAIAENGNTSIDGFWSVENDNGNLALVLNFDSSGSGNPLGDLNDDWDVLESNDSIIRLRDNDDFLTFEREPTGGGSTPDPQELRTVMEAGTWYVDTFLDDGDDETSDFNGFDFTFNANETVSATNGSETVTGIWIVTVVGEELNFEFDMDSPLNGADDDEYKVLQFNDTSVTFIIRDSNGNIEDTLIIKKN